MKLFLFLLGLFFSIQPVNAQQAEEARNVVSWIFDPGSNLPDLNWEAYSLSDEDKDAIRDESVSLKCPEIGQPKLSGWTRTDLNLDGFSDLIHVGPCDPYNLVEIFFGGPKGWRKSWSGGGNPIHLDHPQKPKRYLIIKNAPLACWNAYSFTFLSISKNPPRVFPERTYRASSETFFPVFTMEKKSRIIREGTPLRSEPQKFDKEQSLDCYEGARTEGNILARIPNGAEAVILATRDDYKRGKWAFILTTCPSTLNPDKFHHDLAFESREQETWLMGWVDISDLAK